MRHLASTTASLALLLGLGAAASVVPTAGVAQIGIGISVGFGPPALPSYDQPPIPGYGFIWTPGFWAWDNGFGDYYWVPGAWVRPPDVGLLWTPGYWGWNNGAFLFNDGYWGPSVGFYGGIDYGFGYGGDGYEGGYWRGHQLFYNRAINNLAGARFSTIYSKPIANRRGANNVSFAGGPGGVLARPTPAQLAAQHERHITATATQARQVNLARAITANRAGVNHGKPAIAATRTAGVVKGPGVVPARAAAVYHRPANAPPAKAPAAGAPPAHAAPGHAASHAPALHATHPQAAPGRIAPSPQHAPPQHALPQHPPSQHAPSHAPPHNMPPRAPPEHFSPEHRSPERAGPPPTFGHGPPMGPGGGGPRGPVPGPGGASHGPEPQREPGGADKHGPPHP